MSSEAGHGGKRQGAGRKPILTDMQRLRVGLWCEEAQLEQIKDYARGRMRHGAERRAIRAGDIDSADELWIRLEELQARMRKRAIEGRLPPDLYAKEEGFEDVDLNDDAIELRSLRYNASNFPEDKGRRGLLIAENVRPKGLRSKILREVSAKASAAFGVAVTARLVDECWKEYRRHFSS